MSSVAAADRPNRPVASILFSEKEEVQSVKKHIVRVRNFASLMASSTVVTRFR